MNQFILLIVIFFLPTGIGVANGGPSEGFFAGSYRVSGIAPDTQMPYQGLCEIVRDQNGRYKMIRTIGGVAVEATFSAEEHEDHEGAKRHVFVARYTEGEKTRAITYVWAMANAFVEDNYGLLVGRIRVQAEGPASGAMLDGFETLIPTTESADAFRRRLEDEIKRLGSKGVKSGDPMLDRVVTVYNAISLKQRGSGSRE